MKYLILLSTLAITACSSTTTYDESYAKDELRMYNSVKHSTNLKNRTSTSVYSQKMKAVNDNRSSGK